MLYPIGIQDFESIRRDGYVYVDKTDIIFKLSHGSGKFIFLSRPRRFGKSLLVSTMEAYFSGRKELFDGLAVAGLEKDWARYPILRFDLTGKSYTAADDLQDHLDKQLAILENKYGIKKEYDSVDVRFQCVIEAACEKTGRRVVILIDVLIQTDKFVYIMELKRDKNPDDALDQIDEKGYDWPFLADERKVFKIGANFSTKNHRLENWKLAD